MTTAPDDVDMPNHLESTDRIRAAAMARIRAGEDLIRTGERMLRILALCASESRYPALHSSSGHDSEGNSLTDTQPAAPVVVGARVRIGAAVE